MVKRRQGLIKTFLGDKVEPFRAVNQAALAPTPVGAVVVLVKAGRRRMATFCLALRTSAATGEVTGY